MYINSMEKQLTFFLLIFGIANALFNGILIFLKLFTPASALATTVLAVLLFNCVAAKYCRKKLKIKFSFWGSKQIRNYLFVSMLFIPISLFIRIFQMNYFMNILLIMVLCIGLYGVFLLVSKDPLLEIVLTKFKRRS